MSVRLLPRNDAKGAEILMFNSDGSGARHTLDGLNATAFPSGVYTMPIEGPKTSVVLSSGARNYAKDREAQVPSAVDLAR